VPVEGEALTSDESELLGGAVKGGAGPPLPERERTAFMGQPVSLRSSRRSGGKRALRSGPMVCYLHRNGEIVVPGEGAMLKTNPAQVPDFAKFLDDVTVKLGLMSYCKKLFRPDGTEVTSRPLDIGHMFHTWYTALGLESQHAEFINDGQPLPIANDMMEPVKELLT